MHASWVVGPNELVLPGGASSLLSLLRRLRQKARRTVASLLKWRFQVSMFRTRQSVTRG